MGKGLIGNSLSYTMQRILSGEVSVDDIDKIYAGTCFTEETMPEILSGYQTYWDSAAHDRARNEILQKYGVKKFRELGEEDYYKAYDEVDARADELKPFISAEAEKLLQKLWDEGKVIQTRYRVPKGQKVIAKKLGYGQGQVVGEVEVEGTGQGRYDEIVCINGEYYDYHDTLTSSLGLGMSGLYNNEIELLANQINQSSRSNALSNRDRSFFFQQLFPQYKDAIAKVMEELSDDVSYDLSEKDIYDMLEEATKQKGEHTAEEIGEGIADLTQGEVGEALNTITDIGEPQKDPHTIE